jgi:hypothetical protein
MGLEAYLRDAHGPVELRKFIGKSKRGYYVVHTPDADIRWTVFVDLTSVSQLFFGKVSRMPRSIAEPPATLKRKSPIISGSRFGRRNTK